MNKLKKVFITLIACGFAIAHTGVISQEIRSLKTNMSSIHQGVTPDGTEVYWACDKRMNGPVKILLQRGTATFAFQIVCGEVI